MGLMGAAGMGDGSGTDGNGSRVLQEQARLLARSEPQESWGAAGNRDRDPQVGRWPPWSHCAPLGTSSWSAPEGGFGVSSVAAGPASSHESLASHTQEEIKKKSKKEEEKQMLQAISLVQTKQRVGLSLGRLMGHNGMWIELGES